MLCRLVPIIFAGTTPVKAVLLNVTRPDQGPLLDVPICAEISFKTSQTTNVKLTVSDVCRIGDDTEARVVDCVKHDVWPSSDVLGTLEKVWTKDNCFVFTPIFFDRKINGDFSTPGSLDTVPLAI
jgi:hypothetical protein